MDKKILIIDDSQFFTGHMHTFLEEAGYAVISTDRGREGLALVARAKPDLVLLDVSMPDMDGFEVCRTLRASDRNDLMPIIMLTATGDKENKLRALELGADDYIVKPFDKRELLARIKNTLRRIALNRAASPLTGLSGNIEIQREITDRIASGDPYAVIYVDLDNFKSYNDLYGFAAGDICIKLAAQIMQDQVGMLGNLDDFVGHIGGDDFVLVTTPERAEEICRATIEEFDKKIPGLYRKKDAENGYIITKNRRGVEEQFPLVSISMGIVTNKRRAFKSHLEVSTVATELKKKLKTLDGSNYFEDRRTD